MAGTRLRRRAAVELLKPMEAVRAVVRMGTAAEATEQ